MLGDGTLTKSLRHSFFHLALDVALIVLGVSLIRSSREHRRQSNKETFAERPRIVEPVSSAYALYETGVETALRAVQLMVMSDLVMKSHELTTLRALGASCERLLHVPRNTWPGRSRSGEPTAWFTREGFVVLQRALTTVSKAAVAVDPTEARRFALLRDLVNLSLTT